jgi:hypothetical protein
MKTVKQKANLINMKPIIEETCICSICGSMESSPKNGFCINGHDDRLEIDDCIERFIQASENTGLSIDELINKITTWKDK